MNADAPLMRLLEGWLDGGLSDAEQADLLRQLDADPALRRRFAEQVSTLGATRAASEPNPRWLALFDLLEHGDGSADTTAAAFVTATMGRIENLARPHRRHGLAAWGIAAALALIAAGSFLIATRPAGPSGAPQPVPALAAGPEPRPVAVVLGGSAESEFPVGTDLKPGVVRQSLGWLTIQTLKGVSVTFDAPFDAVLAETDRIRLNQGLARVRVPPGAEGFRLETPSFDVIDLGTEFAARVNADRTGTCRVFEGEANVSLLDSMGEMKQSKRLVENESVRIQPAEMSLQRVDESNEDYPEIKLPPRPQLGLGSGYPAEVMRLDPVAYWRFESITDGFVPNEVESGGMRLRAVGTASIHAEKDGNHSGEISRFREFEYFHITRPGILLQGDFSVSMFVQLDWLQNYALVSAMRYDDKVKGHPFLMQSYAAFRTTGQPGMVLHAVFRDPPGWDGGVEIHGNTELRPHRWHHLAGTRENEIMTLYVDGEIVARKSVGTIAVDSREIFIGRLNGNPGQSRLDARGLVGWIDELAFFSRALTHDEIRRIGIR